MLTGTTVTDDDIRSLLREMPEHRNLCGVALAWPPAPGGEKAYRSARERCAEIINDRAKWTNKPVTGENVTDDDIRKLQKLYSQEDDEYWECGMAIYGSSHWRRAEARANCAALIMKRRTEAK